MSTSALRLEPDLPLRYYHLSNEASFHNVALGMYSRWMFLRSWEPFDKDKLVGFCGGIHLDKSEKRAAARVERAYQRALKVMARRPKTRLICLWVENDAIGVLSVLLLSERNPTRGMAWAGAPAWAPTTLQFHTSTDPTPSEPKVPSTVYARALEGGL